MSQYPLEQMIGIKKNRFDAAIKVLEEKKRILEQAYEKLYDLTQDRDQCRQHKMDKLTQLREALDQGESIKKILQGKTYLKIVDEKLLDKEKKVQEQQKVVDLAQKQVDLATDDLFQKKKDLEKLEMHKKEWLKENEYQLLQKEGLEQDEQGSSTFLARKREKEKRDRD